MADKMPKMATPPTSGGSVKSSKSLFSLTINNRVVEICSININISGLDIQQRQPSQATNLQSRDSVAVEVSLQTAGDLTLQGTTNQEQVQAAPPAIVKAKKKSFLEKFKKKPTADPSPAMAAVPPTSGTNADDFRGDQSASGGGESVGIRARRVETSSPPPALPPQLLLPQLPPQPPPMATGPGIPAASAAAADKRGKIWPSKAAQVGAIVNNGTGDGDDSSDSEVDMSRPERVRKAVAEAASASASNTVESEPGASGGDSQLPASDAGKGKSSGNKKVGAFQLSRRKDKHRGSMDLLGVFNFPQDVPDNAKALFQMTPDLRLIATVYASNAGRSDPSVKKQKRLLTEAAEKRFTVDGRPRSVWLDPSAGDAVEVWKEYFGDDGECHRALGRLPGTDKYGYILPDEVDQKKEFATAEESQAYIDGLEKLAIFSGGIYGNDDDDEVSM